MPEQGLSQFWKESVGAFSAHRQAHVNTSRVVDRVTVWEIFLLIFLQDLNLVFVPVCVNEAQCVRFTIWTHGAVVSLARSLLEYFSTCLVTSSNPKLCRKKEKGGTPSFDCLSAFSGAVCLLNAQHVVLIWLWSWASGYRWMLPLVFDAFLWACTEGELGTHSSFLNVLLNTLSQCLTWRWLSLCPTD